MGFFDNLVNGIQDAGKWVGDHLGEVVGIASGLNDVLNPTKVQDGQSGSNSSANSQTVAEPSWLDNLIGALTPQEAPKAGQSEGSIVGTLMLFTSALVVVVLIAKRG